MQLDLGSPIFDVVVAVSFVFFLLSVIASAIAEGIAGLLRLRAKTLKAGLEGLLGDETLVDKLFEHPLVRTELQKAGPPKPDKEDGPDQPQAAHQARGRKGNPRRGKEKRERGPSYLSPRNFALALVDLLDGGGEQQKSGEAAQQGGDTPAPTAAGKSVGKDVATQLRAIKGAPGGDLPDIPALEKWFDDGMERVSGWYRRKSQLITIAIAVVVAIGLNASALRIVERLGSDPVVRATVVAEAEAAAKSDKFGSEAKPEEGETEAASDLKAAGEDMEGAYAKLDALKLPLFWGGENVPDWTVAEIVSLIIGWLITIIAISLGAPFWFDTLNKLANLRLAGQKPKPEPQARGDAARGPGS